MNQDKPLGKLVAVELSLSGKGRGLTQCLEGREDRHGLTGHGLWKEEPNGVGARRALCRILEKDWRNYLYRASFFWRRLQPQMPISLKALWRSSNSTLALPAQPLMGNARAAIRRDGGRRAALPVGTSQQDDGQTVNDDPGQGRNSRQALRRRRNPKPVLEFSQNQQ